MTLLEYPITRPIILSRWVTVLIFVGWVAWIILVTLVSVAAQGYQYVTVSSTNFNSTQRNWYEKIVNSHSLIPPSWNCSYSVLKLNEGYFFSKLLYVY